MTRATSSAIWVGQLPGGIQSYFHALFQSVFGKMCLLLIVEYFLPILKNNNHTHKFGFSKNISGFMDVLDDLEDITLDTPDAPEVRHILVYTN